MKLTWRIAIASVLLASVLGGCGEDKTTSPFADQNGRPLDLSTYRGRWLLVNYWAEWCKPCVEEIGELNQLAQQQSAQVAVLGVNFDGATGEELRAQMERLGIAFTVLDRDPAAVFATARPAVLPTTLVIDREGKLVQTLVGPQTAASLRQHTVGTETRDVDH